MQYNYLSNETLPTKHKYRGNVFVTTFGLDPNNTEAFNDTVEFNLPNLWDSRKEGIKWFKETIAGLEREGKYFLPYASPTDFIKGKHAAYSVTLSLVEISDGEELEYVLIGEDDAILNDTLEIEEFLFHDVDLRQV